MVMVLFTQIGLMLLIFFPLLLLQGGSITYGLILSVILIFAETVLVAAMALFFTSFSSPYLSGLFCLGLFIAGRNANLITELAKQEKLKAFAPVFDGIARLIPNFYLFYPSGKIIDGTFASVHSQFVSNGYFFYALAYGAAYALLFIVSAIFLISKRDFI
jgi:hypothetical protein